MIYHTKLLFNALVLPHMDYCSLLWSNTTKTGICLVETLQKSWQNHTKSILMYTDNGSPRFA